MISSCIHEFMRYLGAALCFLEPVLQDLALGARKRLSTALPFYLGPLWPSVFVQG